MRVTRMKNCHCFPCAKDFHYLGIASHRSMHRNKKEDCRIEYTNGDIYDHRFSEGTTDTRTDRS